MTRSLLKRGVKVRRFRDKAILLLGQLGQADACRRGITRHPRFVENSGATILETVQTAVRTACPHRPGTPVLNVSREMAPLPRARSALPVMPQRRRSARVRCAARSTGSPHRFTPLSIGGGEAQQQGQATRALVVATSSVACRSRDAWLRGNGLRPSFPTRGAKLLYAESRPQGLRKPVQPKARPVSRGS